jgi:hypothetical protein
MDSWESLRRTNNHEEVAGTILFKHLFVAVPQAKTLFGFPINMDPLSDAMTKSKKFLKVSDYFRPGKPLYDIADVSNNFTTTTNDEL